MKTVEVAAAIIIQENKILVTQRGYGELKDRWEFPGGKIEPGETKEQAIIREIKEELEADIEIICFLNTIEFDYPSFHLIMHNFVCKDPSNHIVLLEHEAARFVTIEEMENIDFLPADLLVVEKLKEYLANR